MLQKKAFRVQQTQCKKKPKKTKSIILKILKISKGLVRVCAFIYKVGQILEGDGLG